MQFTHTVHCLYNIRSMTLHQVPNAFDPLDLVRHSRQVADDCREVTEVLRLEVPYVVFSEFETLSHVVQSGGPCFRFGNIGCDNVGVVEPRVVEWFQTRRVNRHSPVNALEALTAVSSQTELLVSAAA